MIAPIDRRSGFDARIVEATRCGEKILAADPKRMMTAPERMSDDLRALGGRQRRPRRLEQREVLSAAIHQHLIAEAADDREPEDVDIEALGAREVANLDSEMIEPLKFHNPED